MKVCRKYRQWIWLAMYNELQPDQLKELEEHLKTCVECKLDYEETEQMVKLLNQKVQLEPTEQELETNRSDLHQQLLLIRQSRLKTKWWEKLWQILSLDFAPQYRFATALTILIVGIIMGRFFLFSQPVHQSQKANLNIANVEYVKYNPNTKQVSIKLNTLNDMVIEGDLEKPEIQSILAQTLALSDRPNVRLKTVGALSMIKTLNKPILDALVEVLETDNNPGIRLKAVKLLNTLPLNSQVKDLLINTLAKVLLNEKNTAIRIEAINGLTRMNDSDITPLILDAAKNDSSEYLQYKASNLLKRIKIQRLQTEF